MTEPTQTPDLRTDRAATPPAKKPWVAPHVQAITAGEAEVGTRALGRDGAFTTS